MSKQEKCNYCQFRNHGAWQDPCCNCVRNGIEKKDIFKNNGFPLDSMKFDKKGNLIE